MVNVGIALVGLVIGRVDVGDRTIAVPLKVSYIGIFGHDAVYYAKHVVLHLGVGDVQHQLVAIVIRFAVGLLNDPVGVLLKEFALGIDHFGFDPDAKLHACCFGIAYETRNTFRQFAMRYVPVA